MAEAREKPAIRWLTVKEAAEYTRTDEEWIVSHIKAGTLKYVPTARRVVDSPKGPRRRIIDKIKLDALMESLERSEPVVRSDDQSLPLAVPEPKRKPSSPPIPRGMSARERYKSGL